MRGHYLCDSASKSFSNFYEIFVAYFLKKSDEGIFFILSKHAVKAKTKKKSTAVLQCMNFLFAKFLNDRFYMTHEKERATPKFSTEKVF